MNITIITPTLPYPLNSGGAQAQYNFIDKLRKQHSISMIFPLNQKNTKQALQHLQSIWPEVHFHPYSYWRQLTHGPFLKEKIVRAIKLKLCPNNKRFMVERALKPYGFYFTNDFVSFVHAIVREEHSDIIQVEFYQYLPLVKYLPKGIRNIFIQHEIRFIRNQRLLAPLGLTTEEQAYYEQIKQQEIADLNCYDQVIVLTPKDKVRMEQNGVTTPIVVSPAAVNTPMLPYQKWNGTLTFIGGYSHIPNQEGIDWFIRQIIDKLDANRIKAINVVGAGWPQRYHQQHPKLYFLGFVESLKDALQGSVLIVPILTGSGMRMKILDAAAANAPIVTTTVGVEGLTFEHGTSCLIADTPDDFAQAVNTLVADEDKMERLATNAQQIFNDRYSVDALAKVRNNIYLKS